MIEIIKFEYSDKDLMSKTHKIRHEVFVIGQNCPEELEWEFEEDSTHFILFESSIPKHNFRYRITSNGYKLERFQFLKSERGKGFGKEILKFILTDLSEFNGLIYLHAQVDVIPFMKK